MQQRMERARAPEVPSEGLGLEQDWQPPKPGPWGQGEPFNCAAP